MIVFGWTTCIDPGCCSLFLPSTVIIPVAAPEVRERFLLLGGVWRIDVVGTKLDCITIGEFEFVIEDNATDPVTIV